MTPLPTSKGFVSLHSASWRDRIATGIMLIAAVSAFIAFISDISSVTSASPASQVVEIWRMYGFLVFAGLYFLLAFWPRRYPGIWELVILDKAALSITGLALLGRGVAGVETILTIDGSLAAMTIVAYVLARGYSGWARLREPEVPHKDDSSQ